MEARKKIVVHIGYGKTGSSAIQAALARNQNLLRSAGILYPHGNQTDLARKGQISSGNVEPDDWFEGQVIRIARSQDDYRTILFSNENLFHRFYAFLEQEHKYRTEFAFEIILFVREPFEKLNSGYQQAVKRRGFAGDISEFAEHDDDTAHAAALLHALDRQGIAFKLFNYSALRRRAVQAFFEHIGIWNLIRAGEQAEVGTVNRSLNAAELSFLRYVNQVFGVQFGSVIADALVERLPDLPSEDASIDPDTRKRFYARNVEAVAAINAFLPDPERLRFNPDAISLESSAPAQSLSDQQVEVIRSVFPAVLTYKDGVVLRDIAMKYESGTPLTREDAIALMQYAQKARPHGQIIAGKLREWRGG